MTSTAPIPVLRGEERLFFEHLKAHQLIFQTCRTCGTCLWYPRTVCPQCLGVELEVSTSAGRGVVHSFTTLYRAGHPSRAGELPYTVALVDLDEGVRVIGDLSGVEPEDISIGLPVVAGFDDLDEQFTRLAFTPRPASGE